MPKNTCSKGQKRTKTLFSVLLHTRVNVQRKGTVNMTSGYDDEEEEREQSAANTLNENEHI